MFDEFVNQERYSDMLRSAERERLARRVLAAQRAGPGLFRRGRAWLGRHLPGGTK